MATARQERQAHERLIGQLRFGQGPAADRNHGIGSQHHTVLHRFGRIGHLTNGFSLCTRQAQRKTARCFMLLRRFVNIGRQEVIRLQSDLLQQREAARRSGGQDQLRGIGHLRASLAAGVTLKNPLT